MPILNPVERKSFTGKLSILTIYIILILGGITMVYPFSLMLSGSLCSGVDGERYKLIPQYLTDDNMLLLKYIEYKYGTKVKYNPTKNINRNWYTNFSTLRNIYEESNEQNVTMKSNSTNKTWAADWDSFVDKLAITERLRCFDSLMEQDFKLFLLQKYKSISNIKKKLSVNYEALKLPFEDPYRREWAKPDTQLYQDYETLLKSYDVKKWTFPILFDGEFILYLRQKYPDIQTLNQKMGTHFISFKEITLSEKAPGNGLKTEWFAFIIRRLPLRYCKLHVSQKKYQAFIRIQMQDDINRYNKRTGSYISSFQEVQAPVTMPENSEERSLWNKFITKKATPGDIEIRTNNIAFRKQMQKKYNNNIARLNKAWGTKYTDFSKVQPGIIASDLLAFEKEKSHWRWFFLYNNYSVVWRFIAVNGRALWNTLILCFFTVLAQLTVNPMCAYALSRYKMKSTYNILMFFIATMAFPPMVLMIPNFVLMKELGMLNTYWALIIPSMANGYYIFLMKGFFDSLPKELYEAASLEGANEFHMFFKITLPLVKPIMAVKALGAFTMAYGGFMWAFIICQDPKMWTIMVYIYQFQQGNPYHLVMTSLVLASLPLLFMFLFCQKIIMRGIVIPVMK